MQIRSWQGFLKQAPDSAKCSPCCSSGANGSAGRTTEADQADAPRSESCEEREVCDRTVGCYSNPVWEEALSRDAFHTRQLPGASPHIRCSGQLQERVARPKATTVKPPHSDKSVLLQSGIAGRMPGLGCE
jgi:hypothetical protein